MDSHFQITSSYWKKMYGLFHKKRLVRSFCKELGISEVLAEILQERGVDSTQEARYFLEPSDECCHDPFLMRDMEKAVGRIYEAIIKREKIVIYGDSDADGMSATALLFLYLKKIGGRVFYVIPYRLTEGRGLNHNTIQRALKQAPSLLITVDQGSTAVEEMQTVSEFGADIIITDHHQLSDQTPDVFALINPKRSDCNYPFKELCGTGVALKLLEALQQKLDVEEYWDLQGCRSPDLSRFLDLVALATVADHVPLIGENRFYVKKGIELFNHKNRIGLHHLAKECKIFRGIDAYDLALRIAPKINASARLNVPDLGMELLVSNSHVKAQQLAREAVVLNQRRSDIERKFFNLILKNPVDDNQSAFICYIPNVHQGVISGLTGRVAKHFHKPIIILGDSGNGKISGSARSQETINLYEVLQQCEEFLIKFGGHSQALGLELKFSDLEPFRQKFLRICSKSFQNQGQRIQVDTWLSAKQFNPDLIKEVLRLLPFGHGNPVPVFGIQNFELRAISESNEFIF